MAQKNTRLVYVDDINLKIYQSLPDKDFKEFMMVYLTYQKGDDVRDKFTNPMTFALFMTYISKIEYNEDKWEKRAAANKENGKKGGRPKKNNQDIQPNTEFEITPNKALNNQSETIPLPDNKSVSNEQEIGKNNGYSMEDIVRILTAYNIPENAPPNDLLIQDKYMEISRSLGITTGKLQAVQQYRFNKKLKITG